jgi:hypothetical protein
MVREGSGMGGVPGEISQKGNKMTDGGQHELFLFSLILINRK